MRSSIPKSLTFDTLSYFIPSLLRIPRNTSAFPLKCLRNALNKLPITAFSWLETVRSMYWNPAFHILKPCVSYTETLRSMYWNYASHGQKRCVSWAEILCSIYRNCASQEMKHYISVSYKVVRKRCLIRLQEGVGNTAKEHLLQVYLASSRNQKSMCQLWLHENSLQTPLIWE